MGTPYHNNCREDAAKPIQNAPKSLQHVPSEISSRRTEKRCSLSSSAGLHRRVIFLPEVHFTDGQPGTGTLLHATTACALLSCAK
jgi:hypothetical protein